MISLRSQQHKLKQAGLAVRIVIFLGLQTVYLVLNHNGAHRNKENKKSCIPRKKTSGFAGVMKDIILLPNPRMKLLPRGHIWEELYVQGFVATAVTITNEMTASLLQKLKGNLQPCFQINSKEDLSTLRGLLGTKVSMLIWLKASQEKF